jgi:hypothetical protein
VIADLENRPPGTPREWRQATKIGRGGKWRLNLYDPDLTRTEPMEPKPVQTPYCSPMKTRHER